MGPTKERSLPVSENRQEKYREESIIEKSKTTSRDEKPFERSVNRDQRTTDRSERPRIGGGFERRTFETERRVSDRGKPLRREEESSNDKNEVCMFDIHLFM